MGLNNNKLGSLAGKEQASKVLRYRALQKWSRSHFLRGKMTAKGKANHDFQIWHDSPTATPQDPQSALNQLH